MSAQRVGILGGGQLGRMIALAARPLGLEVHVYAPGPEVVAAPVADVWVDAPYEDLDRVRDFAKEVDVVTCEFENVPASAARAVAERTRMAPGPEVLEIAQDRIREKNTVRAAGVPVTDFVVLSPANSVPSAPDWAVFEGGVLKTSRGGYDGKGQARVRDFEHAISTWKEWGRPEAILERFVPFRCEISVMVARGLDGEVVIYEPFLNEHSNHILDLTVMPAPLAGDLRARARRKARAVAEHLDVVGLLCVEMFLLEDDTLVVNELAPRPHNSAHVTMDGCWTSQFEQLLRAILGWPLGSVDPVAPVAASGNLMGELWTSGFDTEALLADPNIRLHLYGKNEARRGRKMGHVNVLADTVEGAVERIRRARDRAAGRSADDRAA